jgi:hypothetical protein
MEFGAAASGSSAAGAVLQSASLVYWTWRNATWVWSTATWKWRDRDPLWPLPTVGVGAQANGGRAMSCALYGSIEFVCLPAALMMLDAAVAPAAIQVLLSRGATSAVIAASCGAPLSIEGECVLGGAALMAAVAASSAISGTVQRPGAATGASASGVLGVDGRASGGGLRTVYLPPTRKSLTVRRAAWQ